MSEEKRRQIFLSTVLDLIRKDESATSSDSDSSTDEMLTLITSAVQRLSETVSLKYSVQQFISLYRIHPNLFLSLSSRYKQSEFYKPTAQGGGRAPIPPEKQMMIFLWFCGQLRATFRNVSDQFDISFDSSRTVLQKISTFLGTLTEEVICWPTNEGKTQAKKSYMERSGIPNVIGCIDIFHVYISSPVNSPEMYLNSDRTHSLQVQFICDNRFKFLDIFAGYPGSAVPDEVLQNSFICYKLPELCKGNYLVGNAQHEISPWCLVPYRDTQLTHEQQHFNICLSKAAADAHRTICVLKERFPCLNFLFLRQVKSACAIIIGCCILHNMSDILDLEYLSSSVNGLERDDEIVNFVQPVATGVEIRDSIAQQLLRSSSTSLLRAGHAMRHTSK